MNKDDVGTIHIIVVARIVQFRSVSLAREVPQVSFGARCACAGNEWYN